VIVGAAGTISSYDGEPTIRVQTLEQRAGFDLPVDKLQSPHRNPVEHLIHCLETGEPLIGPLTPELSRIGQQIVDTAMISAKEKRTVRLLS
jgi:glucose-fructose oxidoreductase